MGHIFITQGLLRQYRNLNIKKTEKKLLLYTKDAATCLMRYEQKTYKVLEGQKGELTMPLLKSNLRNPVTNNEYSFPSFEGNVSVFIAKYRSSVCS
jgi:hypothetical protein